MASCYYCMNPATSKRWVIVSHGRGGRVYFGKRGITGMSAGGGTKTALRGVCSPCSDRLDAEEDAVLLRWVLVIGAILLGVVYVLLRW